MALALKLLPDSNLCYLLLGPEVVQWRVDRFLFFLLCPPGSFYKAGLKQGRWRRRRCCGADEEDDVDYGASGARTGQIDRDDAS